jgi:hypothetical protein
MPKKDCGWYYRQLLGCSRFRLFWGLNGRYRAAYQLTAFGRASSIQIFCDKCYTIQNDQSVNEKKTFSIQNAAVVHRVRHRERCF